MKESIDKDEGAASSIYRSLLWVGLGIIATLLLIAALGVYFIT